MLDFLFATLVLAVLVTMLIVPWKIYRRVAAAAKAAKRTAVAAEGVEYVMREILDRIEMEEAKLGRFDEDEDEEANALGDLERRVAQAFSNHPTLRPRSIDIDIEALDGGVIELAGEVRSQEEFDLATEITRKVGGVNEVISFLKIKPEKDQADQNAAVDGPIPGLEDLGPSYVQTESAVSHSIPRTVGKTRD